MTDLEFRVLKLERDVKDIIQTFGQITPVIKEYLDRLKTVVDNLENENNDGDRWKR